MKFIKIGSHIINLELINYVLLEDVGYGRISVIIHFSGENNQGQGREHLAGQLRLMDEEAQRFCNYLAQLGTEVI